jgi:aerobic carbon-monoxide dehydrogenase small subunit
MSDARPITLKINGRDREVRAAPWNTLLDVLRDQLLLTGAKRGCNQGVCGACTVLVDGWPVRGCLSLPLNLAGREITTIEGLASGRDLTPLQRAFSEAGAIQCGFCTAGMLLSAHALLRETPHPTADEVHAALSGNLCRCSGYVRVVDAVRRAATEAGP